MVMMSLANWATAHGYIDEEWVQIALALEVKEYEDYDGYEDKAEDKKENKDRAKKERAEYRARIKKEKAPYLFITDTAIQRWNDTHFVPKKGKNYTLKERDERIVAAYFEIYDQLKVRGNSEEAEKIRELLKPIFDTLYKPLNKRERDSLFKDNLIVTLMSEHGLDESDAKIISTGITSL